MNNQIVMFQQILQLTPTICLSICNPSLKAVWRLGAGFVLCEDSLQLLSCLDNIQD